MKEYLEKRLENLKLEHANQLSEIGQMKQEDSTKDKWIETNKTMGKIEEVKQMLNYLIITKEN